MADRATRVTAVLLAGIAAGFLAGCADNALELPKISDLNPFKEKQTPLPGRRIALTQADAKLPSELSDASIPINLPPVRANDSWTQPGGDPSNAPGHLALAGSLKQTWSSDAGVASSNKGRVSASPVIADGRVYTLDADGQVSAFSLSGGSAVWRTLLAPESGLKGTGYGGGLAVDGGRLYGASGYGIVAAIDPASGKKLWEKNIGAPVRTSPTAAGDRVYVVSSQGRFFCLNGADGSELWAVRGLPQVASLMNNASPAVDGETVVVPYSSGDLVALKVKDGTAVWTENLTRTRSSSQLASLTDAARPAIEGGIVYAVGHSGRMIATQAKSGERLWSLNVSGTQTPWVAGETVFVVDTAGQLLALARRDGKVQWTTQLPAAKVWSGPTLAGGSLWLVSDKGALVGVDAVTGKLGAQVSIGEAAYIAPVVAQGRLFVLTDKAKLIAFN
jgi:outer membrane protein assembly factor BamB